MMGDEGTLSSGVPMFTEPALREAHDLYMANRFTDSAEAAFRFLEKTPNHRPALRLLADSCYLAGYADEAERAFKILLQLGTVEIHREFNTAPAA